MTGLSIMVIIYEGIKIINGLGALIALLHCFICLLASSVYEQQATRAAPEGTIIAQFLGRSSSHYTSGLQTIRSRRRCL